MKPRDRYVFYKDRPEWADVIPVPQDGDDRNIVKIAYSAQFVDANDYLRAVLLKDERSERALELTATVLILNPANYTVWEYRRRILLSLGRDLEEELLFAKKMIDEHAKNYQLWHHRQWVLTALVERPLQANTSKDKPADKACWGEEELDFLQEVITDDSKNYHAWQHRRWVVTYFKIAPSVELEYTASLLREDVYNNSAWNHRFVSVTKDEGLTPSVLKREVDFVQGTIRSAPNNESAWNYLYGLLVPSPCVVAASRRSPSNNVSPRPDLASFNTSVNVVNETYESNTCSSKRTSEHLTNLVIRPPSAANLRMMRQFAEDLAASDTVAADSVALLGFLVEVYSDCIQALKSSNMAGDFSKAVTMNHDSTDESPTATKSPSTKPDLSIAEFTDLAVGTCERLATELDRIRANYWRYRARQIQSMVYENTA